MVAFEKGLVCPHATIKMIITIRPIEMISAIISVKVIVIVAAIEVIVTVTAVKQIVADRAIVIVRGCCTRPDIIGIIAPLNRLSRQGVEGVRCVLC